MGGLSKKISVVGHFGTLYSYATVGGRVAEALKEAGLLAEAINLDESWHARWVHLGESVTPFTHRLLFTAPNHYVEGFAYDNRERSAIFVSPNTESLDSEHVETINQFGLAIAPSRFCAKTVSLQCQNDFVATLPLGGPLAAELENRPCPPWAFSNERSFRHARLTKRLQEGAPVRCLHFTSDQAWPSRKGTETLLKAWSKWRPDQRSLLTIHGPPSLRKNALYMVADLGIDQSVTYEVSPRLGTSDAQLLDLYNAADLVIQPSRCEGFGMMMLGALVAGVPLLSTCNTGHAEFLVERPGQWMPIPTLAESPIAFEKGLASTLDSELLAESLGFAMTNTAREWLLRRSAMEKPSDWGTWESALPQWMERLKAWTEDT